MLVYVGVNMHLDSSSINSIDDIAIYDTDDCTLEYVSLNRLLAYDLDALGVVNILVSGDKVALTTIRIKNLLRNKLGILNSGQDLLYDFISVDNLYYRLVVNPKPTECTILVNGVPVLVCSSFVHNVLLLQDGLYACYRDKIVGIPLANGVPRNFRKSLKAYMMD